MTAVNLFVTPGAAYLISDRAGCDGDGIVRSLRRKIVTHPRHRVAMSVTGISTNRDDEYLQDFLGACASESEVVARLPHALRGLLDLRASAVAFPLGAMPLVTTIALAHH